jgi:4-hydroxymandelate oxidase
MNYEASRSMGRRRFMEYLLQSPLVLAAGSIALSSIACHTLGTGVKSGEVINVFDLMELAKKNLSTAHWEYLMTGVEDNLTRQANLDGFRLFQIRPRRFVDTEQVDTSVQIFGQRYPSPIVLAPAGSQRAFHPDGELAVARAAHARGNQMILSAVSSCHVQDVVREYQGPLWFQLYQTNDWSIGRQVIQRAEDAGCPVLVVLVDRARLPKSESLLRAGAANRDAGICRCCHESGVVSFIQRHPMYQGLNPSLIRAFNGPVTWDLIDRIRSVTHMKLVVKGIMTAEDADLCVKHGMDGIIVSNHGGREETLMGTIEALPEVVDAVKGKIPVLIDGGFRRGTDVFKALAIGATAICIGRPYLWGLGAFGQQGVERAIEILHDELTVMMAQAGTTAIDKITPVFVRRASGQISESRER